MDDLAALHVPAVVGLVAELDFLPADEDAAMVRVEAARAFGDRLLAFRIEDVQVGLVGLFPPLRSRIVVGVHITGDEPAVEEDIEVLSGRVLESEPRLFPM